MNQSRAQSAPICEAKSGTGEGGDGTHEAGGSPAGGAQVAVADTADGVGAMEAEADALDVDVRVERYGQLGGESGAVRPTGQVAEIRGDQTGGGERAGAEDVGEGRGVAVAARVECEVRPLEGKGDYSGKADAAA